MTDRGWKTASLVTWMLAAAAGGWYFHNVGLVAGGRGDALLLLPGALAGGGTLLALYLWTATKQGGG